MKVTVIIPIYNVEEYLYQCVSSVLCQTYGDIQVILVDDGSTDSCGAICDDFAGNDPRIVVIHKQNGGLSSARNAGIAAATGEWVLFLDGDDYWGEASGLQRLMEDATADVVNFGFTMRYEPRGEEHTSWNPQRVSSNIHDLSSEEQFSCLVREGCYFASACNKLIRRALFAQHDLHFREGRTSEDIDWCARLAFAAGSFGVSRCCFYRYRQRPQSISKTMTLPKLRDLKENIEQCVKILKKHQIGDVFKTAYWNYVAYQYGTFLVSAPHIKESERKILVKDIEHLKWLLNYHENQKVHLLFWINRIGGYTMLCFACKGYAAYRRLRGV